MRLGGADNGILSGLFKDGEVHVQIVQRFQQIPSDQHGYHGGGMKIEPGTVNGGQKLVILELIRGTSRIMKRIKNISSSKKRRRRHRGVHFLFTLLG